MLSSIYGLAADGKNFLFDTGLADAVDLHVPVLSIGNLSMGGTGKTPVAHMIMQLALDKGLRPVVVARNYMARSRGVNRVDIQRTDGAAFYGDEAFLLAQKFPQIPVWTGPKKYITAQMAVQQDKPNLVIVDDGFQHRSLKRNFDMVLIDCSTSADEDFLLPRGRLREGFASLQRADLVALTKVNWASPERVQNLLQRMPNPNSVCEIEFHHELGQPLSPDAKVMAVSGVAKPDIFEAGLQSHLGPAPILAHMKYADHFDYQAMDADQILKKMQEVGATQILTTEKDLVKLQAFPQLKDILNPLILRTEFRKAPTDLYDFLDRSSRH